MRTFMIIVGSLFLLAGIVFGGYLLEWWAAPFIGKLEERKEVQSGDVRRVSYERFHDLYTGIKSTKRKLESQRRNLKQTEDSREQRRLRQVVSGLEAQLSDAISEYNAMANKETVGQFRDANLPTHIEYPPKDLPSIPSEPATR